MRGFAFTFAAAMFVSCGALLVPGQVVGSQTASNTTVAATTPQIVTGDGADEDRYRIGYQDIIDIQVFKHPELAQKVAVGPAGTIALYRLDSPVVAVCRTERELANDIREAYKEHYLKDPQVHVSVAEQKSGSIAVIGAVERPGNYYISKRMHLLEMLAYAGGPNKESGTRHAGGTGRKQLSLPAKG